MQPANVEVEAHGGVADDFVEVPHCQVVITNMTFGGAGRGVDIESGLFAEFADAKEMGSVRDDDDVMETVFVGDGREAVDLLLRIDRAGFGNDAAKWDSVGK